MQDKSHDDHEGKENVERSEAEKVETTKLAMRAAPPVTESGRESRNMRKTAITVPVTPTRSARKEVR
jgi:hypothetical protein